MRCFTDEELRRGLDAVIASWNRCTVCDGLVDSEHHERSYHAFKEADVLDLFLKAARLDDREMPHGDRDPPP
jgi:hypothetical protein